VLLRPL